MDDNNKENKIMNDNFFDRDSLVCDLKDALGETVTIFTTSGGASGSGFTGVLIDVSCKFVRLLTSFGAAPTCPVGSDCISPYRRRCRGYGGYGGRGYGGRGFRDFDYYNPVGSVTTIPIDRIASFTQNAI